MSDDFTETANILVFVALPEEHDRLLNVFPSTGAVENTQNLMLEHDIATGGFRMFSVLSEGMGIDHAYDAVARAISQLSPNLVVCLGIAGSLSSDLKIGDVSVSSEIVDISQNMKITEVPLTERRTRSSKRSKGQRRPPTKTVVELSPKAAPVPPELSASFRFTRSHPNLKNSLADWVHQASERRAKLKDEISSSGLEEELAQEPAAEIGPMISGPVVASSAFRETLTRINRKVLSVETESAGVFRACQDKGIPSVTIRGISDHADVNKNALERTTKQAARQLAMDNALAYFQLHLLNPMFMRVAATNREGTVEPDLFGRNKRGPDDFLRKVTRDLDEYLDKMSPEYRHRPNNASLPLPRVSRDLVEDDLEDVKSRMPKGIFEALEANRKLFLRIPKSYPNQTLAWSLGQALLRHEIDGKQVLPLVVSGEEIIPPSKGVCHATGVNPENTEIRRDFSPVIVVSEPLFHSEPRVSFLIQELQSHPDVPIIIISRAEAPTERIDNFKSELGLVDHSSAPVPFHEIANYLEVAFEMKPAEADSVASRLDDTFSKFRLHTHPAYFVGLQEATIDALIQANHRAELIQLAVDGLLSFVVAFDESKVKLGRTTREEFLSDLAFEIRVERRSFSRADLFEYVLTFAKRKALEIQAEEFLRGYFSVGLLHDTGGCISFSLPYLEAYLLSERLRLDPETAERYFNPEETEFDHFAFDLYIERGACPNVVSAICRFAKSTLEDCDADTNVYEARKVRPHALSSPHMLLHFAEELSRATIRMTENSEAAEVRNEKQRLLDTREAVRDRVASQAPTRTVDLPEAPPELLAEFSRLDRLSRSSTLLATVIGSGAERLDGTVKEEIANLILRVFERFLHYWTLNRQKFNFSALREELKSDEAIDQLIEQLGLFVEDRETVRDSILVFMSDQELRLLSGPASVLFNRLVQHAGVRSLRPIFAKAKGSTAIERVFRDVWLMDVEHNDGKKALKGTLQKYKGSPLLRLVITNHLLNRVFWHHWQRDSKASFVDVARYALAPMGLKPDEGHTQKMLTGPGGKRI
jgi:nucleoside phosphorylase